MLISRTILATASVAFSSANLVAAATIGQGGAQWEWITIAAAIGMTTGAGAVLGWVEADAAQQEHWPQSVLVFTAVLAAGVQGMLLASLISGWAVYAWVCSVTAVNVLLHYEARLRRKAAATAAAAPAPAPDDSADS